MVNLKERRKKYSLTFFQSRGNNTLQVILWGIFNHVFGVALWLAFSPRIYENMWCVRKVKNAPFVISFNHWLPFWVEKWPGVNESPVLSAVRWHSGVPYLPSACIKDWSLVPWGLPPLLFCSISSSPLLHLSSCGFCMSSIFIGKRQQQFTQCLFTSEVLCTTVLFSFFPGKKED